MSPANSFDIPETLTLTPDINHELCVKVKGATAATDSLWSDIVILCVSMPVPSYNQNTVSWDHVLGAEYYEVRVNGGDPFVVSCVLNYAEITLTQAGINVINVRFYGGNEYSVWESVEVFAYAVNFDSLGGDDIITQYYAVGDTIKLPEVVKTGFDFAGWYDSPDAGSGVKYTDVKFTAAQNLTLYAHWTPKTYTVY